MKPIWILIAFTGAALLCPTVQAAPPKELLGERQSTETTPAQPIASVQLEPIAESALPPVDVWVVEVQPADRLSELTNGEPETNAQGEATSDRVPEINNRQPEINDRQPQTSDREPETSDRLPETSDRPPTASDDVVEPDLDAEDPELQEPELGDGESVEAEPKPDLDNGEAPSASTDAEEDAIAPDSPTDAVNSPVDADPSTTLANEDRQQLLIEADRLYLQGQYEQAEFLYRKAKEPFVAEAVRDRPAAISDPTQLPPAGQVYEAGGKPHPLVGGDESPVG